MQHMMRDEASNPLHEILVECAGQVLSGASSSSEASTNYLLRRLIDDGLQLDTHVRVVAGGEEPWSLVGAVAHKGLLATTCLLLELGAPTDALGPRLPIKGRGNQTRQASLPGLMLDAVLGAQDGLIDIRHMPDRLVEHVGPGDHYLDPASLMKACVEVYGIDMNCASGSEPVGAAVLHGAPSHEQIKERLAMLKVLGADPNQRDQKGRTLIHALFDDGSNFHNASARARFLGVLRHLLDFGVDINAQDKHGQTLLHRACRLVLTGSQTFVDSVVGEIIKLGADPTVLDTQGRTAAFEPFDRVRRLEGPSPGFHHTDVVSDNAPLLAMINRLVKAGMDLSAVDSGGRSLADAIREQAEFLERLRDAGKFLCGDLRYRLPPLAAEVESLMLTSRRAARGRSHRGEESGLGL